MNKDTNPNGDHSSFVRPSDFERRQLERSDVILTPMGSAGDVLPFVWLGRLLRERGHHVTIITAVVFDEIVRATGLNFVGLGTPEEFDALIADPDVWHGWRGPELIFRHVGKSTASMFDAIRDAVRPGAATLLLAPGTSFAARLAREKLGLPLIGVHLQPACYLSTHETPILAPQLAWVTRMPRWVKEILLGLPNPMDRWAGPGVRAACEAQGIPAPRRLYFDWFHSPDGDLALFPEWFAAPQPDWPEQVHQHSFPLEDLAMEQAMPLALADFLATGDRPVLFTVGSAMRHGAEFFATAIRVCAETGRRGIFATRYPDQLPSELPAGICSVEYVPFGRVLPHCAALVHHGGIGTTAQGLAAGVPHVVMPMAHDQPDNAARLVWLGVGRTLPPRKFNAATLAAALAQIVDQPDVQRATKALAERLRGDRSTARMIEWIESRIRPRSSPGQTGGGVGREIV